MSFVNWAQMLFLPLSFTCEANQRSWLASAIRYGSSAVPVPVGFLDMGTVMFLVSPFWASVRSTVPLCAIYAALSKDHSYL